MGQNRFMAAMMGVVARLPFAKDTRKPKVGYVPLEMRALEPGPPTGKRRATKRPLTKARAHHKMRMRMQRESRRRNR